MMIPGVVMDCTKTFGVSGVAGQRVALTSVGVPCGPTIHNCVVFMGLRAIDLRVQKTVLLAVD